MTDSATSTDPHHATGNNADFRLVAFYLPQYHPIKENDEWWGKGFTEWTNVTRAEPLFFGHYQPHLPTDLGFYDLRVRETRHEQIKLAKEFGIDGFCYHYYWFSGTRLLNQPLDDMLADPESDMPFCLCWANENWTRRWNGGDQDILMEQKYQQGDPANFIRDIAPFLSDPRYIRVAGKPLLIIYRPQLIPDICATAEEWRKHCHTLGLGEIHLCAALTFDNLDYAQFGFDSGVEFPPHNRNLLGTLYVHQSIDFYRSFDGTAMLYHDLANAFLKRSVGNLKVFRSVFPCWDNTARVGSRANIIINGTPDNYEYWLCKTIEKVRGEQPKSHRLVFINAWNEWAEGCHLEPDQKYGRAFLEATLQARSGRSTLGGFTDTGIPEAAVVGASSFLADLGRLLRKHWSYLVAHLHKKLRQVLAKNPRLKAFLKSLLSMLGRGGRS
jgi:lipopolysaccharide biosynthesis protein